MPRDFAPELAKYPKSRPKPTKYPKMRILKTLWDTCKILSPYRKSGSLSKNITSDFVPELAIYLKSSPKPLNSTKWDHKNDARYAENFFHFIGNRIRQARTWRQILHRTWLNSPNIAPNPKIVQHSVWAYCLTLYSNAACCCCWCCCLYLVIISAKWTQWMAEILWCLIPSVLPSVRSSL